MRGRPNVRPEEEADKRTVLLHEVSYTKRPRFSDEDVEVCEKDDILFIRDDTSCCHKDWDDGIVQAQGSVHWDNGGGLGTEHVSTHFATDLGLVPFVRLLKRLKQEDVNGEVAVSGSAASLGKQLQTPKLNGVVDNSNSEEAAPPPEDIIERYLSKDPR